MESSLQWVGSVLTGARQTDGVMEWRDLEPHPQCSSTPLQGIRAGVGDPQPLLAQWKGKGLGQGQKEAKSSCLEPVSREMPREQHWHWEKLLLCSSFLFLQLPGKSIAFAVFFILLATSHTLKRGDFTAMHPIL